VSITFELGAEAGDAVTFDVGAASGDDVSFDIPAPGTGTTVHGDLTGRDEPGQHSSDAITVGAGTMPVVESVDPPADNKLTTLLASTDATIAAVGGNAAAIAGDLATTQGDVAALQTDVTTLQTDVGTAQAAAEAAQADATAAQADLADVEIPYDAGPESGGKWAVVCTPGQYTTPDIGPFIDGFSCKARVMAIAPDPAATGSTVSFLEFLTQIRQAHGGWGDDQDNKELALPVQYDSVGVFDEHCQTDTAAPVQAGEYTAGRVSWQPFYAPNDYVFADASFRLGLGEPIWLWQEHVFDDGAGQWRKTIWRRTDQAGSDFEDADGVYWRRIVEKVGTDGPGSIADAGMPWQIGTNPGLLAVESITVYDGATPRLHFDTADAQLDGTVASSLIPGQVWTPNGSPYIVDTTLAGLAALATGGGGAVDSVNGETGTVVLTAADVGADPAGTAAALVDDLSGVSNASTARTNLGLGSLATLSAIASANITDGTIVAADLAASLLGRIPTTVTVASDVPSPTDGTFTNTTGLAVPVVNGSTYYMVGMLDVTGINAADLRVSLTCPTGEVRLSVQGKAYSATVAAADTAYSGEILASGDIVTNLAVITGRSTLVPFQGRFTATADGTLQIQHSQRTANATATTVKAGSYLTYHT